MILYNTLLSTGIEPSSSLRRKIYQGAVRVDGEVIRDPAFELKPGAHRITIGPNKSVTIVIGKDGNSYRVIGG